MKKEEKVLFNNREVELIERTWTFNDQVVSHHYSLQNGFAEIILSEETLKQLALEIQFHELSKSVDIERV